MSGTCHAPKDFGLAQRLSAIEREPEIVSGMTRAERAKNAEGAARMTAWAAEQRRRDKARAEAARCRCELSFRGEPCECSCVLCGAYACPVRVRR